MKQTQFDFMNTDKMQAQELLRQVMERNPSNAISLKELIYYVREYDARGEEIYCTDNGRLFSRKRGSG